MKKLFLISIVTVIFSILMSGCGGGDGCSTTPPENINPTPPISDDPNAPIAKLDPTLLDIEFD